MHRNTSTQRVDRRLWSIIVWSLVSAFALFALANFMLRHLSTGQTIALFAFAFLEMLIIRTIARDEGNDGATMSEACCRAALAEADQATGSI